MIESNVCLDFDLVPYAYRLLGYPIHIYSFEARKYAFMHHIIAWHSCDSELIKTNLTEILILLCFGPKT